MRVAMLKTGSSSALMRPIKQPFGLKLPSQVKAFRLVRLVVVAATETAPKPGKDGRMKPDKAHMKPDKAHKKMLAEGEKAEKAELKRVCKEAEARGALYLLHWHCCAEELLPAVAQQQGRDDGAAAAEGQTRQYIMTLQDDLARMEKVSKDAVWYMTKEAANGMHHVLLVSAKAKHAAKYGLEELPPLAETHSVSLGPSDAPIDIPLASLRALVQKQRQDKEAAKKKGEESGSEEEEPAVLREHGDAETAADKKLWKEEKRRLRGALPMAPVSHPDLDLTKLSYD